MVIWVNDIKKFFALFLQLFCLKPYQNKVTKKKKNIYIYIYIPEQIVGKKVSSPFSVRSWKKNIRENLNKAEKKEIII